MAPRRSPRIAAAKRQKTTKTGSNAFVAPSPNAPRSQWDRFLDSETCQNACTAEGIWTKGVSAQSPKIRALFIAWLEAYVDAIEKQDLCNDLQRLLLNPNRAEDVTRAFGQLFEAEALGNPQRAFAIKKKKADEAKELQATAKTQLNAALEEPEAKWVRVVNSEAYAAAWNELRKLAPDLFTEQLCIERFCEEPEIRDLFTDWFDKRDNAMFYQGLYNDSKQHILPYAATLFSPNELHELTQEQNELHKQAQDTNKSKAVAETHLITGLKQHLKMHKTK